MVVDLPESTWPITTTLMWNLSLLLTVSCRSRTMMGLMLQCAVDAAMLDVPHLDGVVCVLS